MLTGQDLEKRSRAREWLRRLGPSDRVILSPQVLNEAYSVLTLKHRLHPVDDGVRVALARYMRWVRAPLDVDTIAAAWALQDRYNLRIWDALLLASANLAGCGYFLSEDLNDGQQYGVVQAINPFRHAPEDVLGRALPN
ncbi:MAG TPA: PIN domain-containing protein [Caulobacteraceae bacterium]